MRKTVHLCLSSHDEIMYRSDADLIMGFNCLALATLETESRLLAEGFMTTHHHCLVQTDDYKEIMHRSRYAYARYFNAKYRRIGSLGEKTFFSLEVEGLFHTTAALNYIIRQGLHHGLSTTPFGYPHCSANAFFRKDLGKAEPPRLLPDSKRYLYLPKRRALPADRYRMSKNGLLLREDILDTAYVEETYVTPRNFLYQMNKLSGERDFEEQRQENNTPPVTVEAIETGVPDFDAQQLKITEQGKVDRKRMTDIELCAIVDTQFVPWYCKRELSASIYQLSESQRAGICEILWQESRQFRFRPKTQGYLSGKYVTESQLRRCLCLRKP